MLTFKQFQESVEDPTSQPDAGTAEPQTVSTPPSQRPWSPRTRRRSGVQDPYAAVNAGEYGEAARKLKSIFNERDYETFVRELQGNINDPKIRKLIMSGLLDSNPSDDKVKVRLISIAANQMRPTQNEIGVSNSLHSPLTKRSYMIRPLLDVGKIELPKLVTAAGEYIIDGHHRWSQVFCINPEAVLDCVDMATLTDPTKALKVTQLAIAGIQGTVPMATTSGANLLTLPLDKVKDYVMKVVSAEAVEAFTSSSNPRWLAIYKGTNAKEAVAEYVGQNVGQMQTRNAPEADAPARNFMPQTGDVMGYVSSLGLGKVNFAEPLVAAEAFRQWLENREKRA
jgi:hypothetical protein